MGEEHEVYFLKKTHSAEFTKKAMWSGNKRQLASSGSKRGFESKLPGFSIIASTSQTWAFIPMNQLLARWNDSLNRKIRDWDTHSIQASWNSIKGPSGVWEVNLSSCLAIIWSHWRRSILFPIPTPQRIQGHTHTQACVHVHTCTRVHTHIHKELDFLLPHLEKGGKRSAFATCLPRVYTFTSPLRSIFRDNMEQNKNEHIGKNCGKIWRFSWWETETQQDCWIKCSCSSVSNTL